MTSARPLTPESAGRQSRACGARNTSAHSAESDFIREPELSADAVVVVVVVSGGRRPRGYAPARAGVGVGQLRDATRPVCICVYVYVTRDTEGERERESSIVQCYRSKGERENAFSCVVTPANINNSRASGILSCFVAGQALYDLIETFSSSRIILIYIVQRRAKNSHEWRNECTSAIAEVGAILLNIYSILSTAR